MQNPKVTSGENRNHPRSPESDQCWKVAGWICVFFWFLCDSGCWNVSPATWLAHHNPAEFQHLSQLVSQLQSLGLGKSFYKHDVNGIKQDSLLSSVAFKEFQTSNSNWNVNLIIANHIIMYDVAKNTDHLKGLEMVKWTSVGFVLEFIR